MRVNMGWRVLPVVPIFALFAGQRGQSLTSIFRRKKLHIAVGRLAALCQAAGQRPHMQLQLMSIRVEKVKRIALAAVLPPFARTDCTQLSHCRCKIILRYIEGVMRVIALCRWLTRCVQRQTQPKLPHA